LPAFSVWKDFAYWRALTKAIETAATPAEQAWFEDALHDETSWKRPPAVQQQSVHGDAAIPEPVGVSLVMLPPCRPPFELFIVQLVMH